MRRDEARPPPLALLTGRGVDLRAVVALHVLEQPAPAGARPPRVRDNLPGRRRRRRRRRTEDTRAFGFGKHWSAPSPRLSRTKSWACGGGAVAFGITMAAGVRGGGWHVAVCAWYCGWLRKGAAAGGTWRRVRGALAVCARACRQPWVLVTSTKAAQGGTRVRELHETRAPGARGGPLGASPRGAFRGSHLTQEQHDLGGGECRGPRPPWDTQPRTRPTASLLQADSHLTPWQG